MYYSEEKRGGERRGGEGRGGEGRGGEGRAGEGRGGQGRGGREGGILRRRHPAQSCVSQYIFASCPSLEYINKRKGWEWRGGEGRRGEGEGNNTFKSHVLDAEQCLDSVDVLKVILKGRIAAD